jgi:hypothetical protein
MNPVTRMMKRHIKTPLKYALPLLFIGALVLSSTAGCVTNTTTKNESGGGSGNAGVDVIINSKQLSSRLGSGYLASTPSAGNQYLILNVTVKNLNDQDADIGDPYYFTLTASDGSVYEHASSSSYLDNAIQSVSHTSPGEKVTGQIAFEIPRSATPSKLQYDDYSNKVIVNIETGVGGNTTFNSDFGFKITYPTSLVAETTNDPTTQVKMYIFPNPNSKVDGVNVGTVGLNEGQTLGSFVDTQMANITKYPNYQEISKNATTVFGKPAQTIVFQATVSVTQASGTTDVSLKVMEIFTINNNTGYLIAYKAVPSDYDTYLSQAEQIINSFAFT